MPTADKNLQDHLAGLATGYHRQRQQSITEELLDIGGSSSFNPGGEASLPDTLLPFNRRQNLRDNDPRGLAGGALLQCAGTRPRQNQYRCRTGTSRFPFPIPRDRNRQGGGVRWRPLSEWLSRVAERSPIHGHRIGERPKRLSYSFQ